MNRKFGLILVAPLLLGFSAAWAQDTDEDAPELPAAAAEEARDAAQLPDAATYGLNTAAEATMRLMEDDEDEVTHDVELPTLPEGAEGDRGLATAADAIAGGAEFGLEMAGDAADAAQDAVEGRGRAEDLPVDVPGRPDIPVDPPAGPPGT